MNLFSKLRSTFSGAQRQEHSQEDIKRARALFAQPDISEEARERKYRSEAILRNEGVHINLFLPVIETEAEIKLRTKEEVAHRIMALLAVAVKGEGLEQPQVEEFIAEYGISDHFTPEERSFIEGPSDEATSARFSWRYEAVWTLLWSLSFVKKLAKPVAQCDAAQGMWFLHTRTAEKFMADARLRTPKEILDQADLIYRYDWAAVDARVNGRQAEINGEITVERHHAILWLIGRDGDKWDDIRTDT